MEWNHAKEAPEGTHVLWPVHLTIGMWYALVAKRGKGAT